MGAHTLPADLEAAGFPTAANKMFKTDEGWAFGCGTTLPSDADVGWAPGALFVDTNASSGNLSMNIGTKASATWKQFTNPS